jgi:TRAP-type C4-dicarboxylate transport system permease small subunit
MKGARAFVAALCGWVAAAFLAAMMLLTVADVALRWTVGRPIRGTLELVELLLTGTFFLALPAVFLRDEHIVVDLVDSRLPRAVPALKRLALAVAAAMLAVITWQSWIFAENALAFGDVTSDLSLPLIWYWSLLLVGIAGAAIVAAVLATRPRGGADAARE